jgi:hypothetical protein
MLLTRGLKCKQGEQHLELNTGTFGQPATLPRLSGFIRTAAEMTHFGENHKFPNLAAKVVRSQCAGNLFLDPNVSNEPPKDFPKMDILSSLQLGQK